METETLHQGRLAVTNPIDDTHKTFKHLKNAGITEAQAEVFTETFKGLSDQTMQVNENLLMVHDGLDNKITGVRDEFREEFTAVREDITGIRLELKDIHHNAASNYQKLDAKIDNTYQKLDAKIDNTYQSLDKKIDSNFLGLDAKIDSNFLGLDAKIDSNFLGLDAKIDSNFLGLDKKIDNNYQSLDKKIDSNFLGLDKKIDFSHTTLLGYMEKSNAQAQAHQAQTQVSYMRWNIGMFIGLAGLMIALIRPWE